MQSTPVSVERGDLVSEDSRRDDTFDELTRSLAAGTITRRRSLKLFAASVLGSLLPASVAEARLTCRSRGQRCGGDRPECCGTLECRRGGDGVKRCRRACRSRGQRCGGDRPECCGTLECRRGGDGVKRCRRSQQPSPPPPCHHHHRHHHRHLTDRRHHLRKVGKRRKD